MSMQDPVSDMLTSIRNAQMIGLKKIRLPYSNLKNQMLKVLQDEGYIDSFETVTFDNKKDIQITLKYFHGRPVIEKIKRVSRPGLRVYKSCDKIPLVRGGLGVTIISTPKGVVSDKAARSLQVGGEILCTVE